MLTPVHRTGFMYDDACRRHRVPAYHPEHPDRLSAVLDGIQKIRSLLHPIEARPVTREQILACHDMAYVELVEREIAQGVPQLSTGDTEVCVDSLAAAQLAAGGVCAMVDAVMSGAVDNGFCAVRPPGHHATPNRGMGFCIFNNIAIGARYAQKQYGCERVLIVDWDVHHGNGTQDIFYEDASVFFFSVHQYPFYPGTGAHGEQGRNRGEGYTMNCPLPAGTVGKEVLGVFQSTLLPAVERFRPDLILISAGFDSRMDDPLGDWLLTDRDFADLTLFMLNCASLSAQGRVISVLEGGYNLQGLGWASAVHVETLVTG